MKINLCIDSETGLTELSISEDIAVKGAKPVRMKKIPQVLPLAKVFELIPECLGEKSLTPTEPKKMVRAPLLPPNCLSWIGTPDLLQQWIILHIPKGNFDSELDGIFYPGVPYPEMIMAVNINGYERGTAGKSKVYSWSVGQFRVACLKQGSLITPTTPVYLYPYSHVSGFGACFHLDVQIPNPLDLRSLEYIHLNFLGAKNSSGHGSNANGAVLHDLFARQGQPFDDTFLKESGKTITDFIGGLTHGEFWPTPADRLVGVDIKNHNDLKEAA